MKSIFKRGHYLTRFFLFLSTAVFVGYRLTEGNPLFYIFLGPPVYLADFIKKRAGVSIDFAALLPSLSKETINDYFFLLPVTFIYFLMIAFFLKQLLKEQGILKVASIVAVLGFLAYLHFKTWTYLTGYLIVPA